MPQPAGVAAAEEEQVLTPEQQAEEAQAAAELEAGFSGTPTEKKTPPAEDEETPPAEETPNEEPPPAEPKYRQVTETEWNELQAKAALVDTLKTEHGKKLDQAFGKVGGLERVLNELKAATPQGIQVEVTDDIVAEMKAEFPETADMLLKSLKNFASKLKGTAPAATAALDPEMVSKYVAEQFQASQEALLEDEHPGWRSIVGTQDDETNEYRKWLKTQPAEYQQRLASTNSVRVIGNSITKFQEFAAAAGKAADEKAAAEEKARKTAEARKKRLEDAAQPRAAGGHQPAPNDDDQFEAGFKSG